MYMSYLPPAVAPAPAQAAEEQFDDAAASAAQRERCTEKSDSDFMQYQPGINLVRIHNMVK